MKKITSITMHTTNEGKRLSYTYSVIDEETGAVISNNNRDSMVVLETTANQTVLKQMEGVQEYVQGKIEV